MFKYQVTYMHTRQNKKGFLRCTDIISKIAHIIYTVYIKIIMQPEVVGCLADV